MGDNPQSGSIQFQQAAQAGQPAPAPVPPSPVQPAGGNGSAPNPSITPELVQQVAEAIRKDPSFKTSMFQHTDARVQQAVEAKVAQLKQLGITPTPEQTQALTQKVQQDLGQQPAAPTPSLPTPPTPAPTAPSPTGQAPAPQSGEAVDPVTAEAYAIMKQHGLEGEAVISENDPEFALIDQKTQSPYAFLKSVEQAAVAKAVRLQRDPAARSPTLAAGGGAGNPIANITDPYELLKGALTK